MAFDSEEAYTLIQARRRDPNSFWAGGDHIRAGDNDDRLQRRFGGRFTIISGQLQPHESHSRTRTGMPVEELLRVVVTLGQVDVPVSLLGLLSLLSLGFPIGPKRVKPERRVIIDYGMCYSKFGRCRICFLCPSSHLPESFSCNVFDCNRVGGTGGRYRRDKARKGGGTEQGER